MVAVVVKWVVPTISVLSSSRRTVNKKNSCVFVFIADLFETYPEQQQTCAKLLT